MRLLTDPTEAARYFAGRDAAPPDPDDRVVTDIIERVRRDGDAAVRELSELYDGFAADPFPVPAAAYGAAERSVPDDLKAAIRLSIDRVRAYYRAQPTGGFMTDRDGSRLGLLVRPLRRVACYVPGGTAPLFSTLIMTAVPALEAGVTEVVAATPPRPDGSVHPAILFVARELGVDLVYRMGGAQAIAALALGTESVPRVDKIVGPGNRFVVKAKRQLFGAVGIEALPGPTETLVLADETADPDHVIADLLAQAEHVGAQPVLVTTSPELAETVLAGLPAALADLPTAATAAESLERGAVVLVGTLEQGVEVANAYAPEHLCLLVRDPWALVEGVRNAGGLFLGHASMESLGDYLAGPSHVMPTGGSARFASFLNLRDFQKVIPVVDVSEEVLREVGPAAARMAREEGLEAHARAILARLDP